MKGDFFGFDLNNLANTFKPAVGEIIFTEGKFINQIKLLKKKELKHEDLYNNFIFKFK